MIKKKQIIDRKKQPFIPAARFHIFTSLYDLGCSVVGLGRRYRREVINHLPLNHQPLRVLDAGCGPGRMTREIKKKYPKIELTGIDADPRILAIAKQKANKEHLSINYQQAFIQHLPFPTGTFDVVYSSLVVHHLPTNVKIKAINEIKRVLKTDGTFLLADFGKPRQTLFSPFSWFTVLFEEGRDNYQGKIPEMMKQAGFREVQKVGEYRYNVHFLMGKK